MLAPGAVWGETVILQLQVLEGEGGVFAASSRALKPVTVRVTDETGAPVTGAAVSFRLPEEGVTGIFQNGLRTDMTLSGPDGRAVAPNITWGPLAGQARLRVTAAFEEARAGVLVPVYVSAENVVVAGAAASTAMIQPQQQRFDPSPAPQLKKKRRWVKWVVIAAVADVAVSIILVKRAARVPGPSAGPGVSVGQPTISIGRYP